MKETCRALIQLEVINRVELVVYSKHIVSTVQHKGRKVKAGRQREKTTNSTGFIYLALLDFCAAEPFTFTFMAFGRHPHPERLKTEH